MKIKSKAEKRAESYRNSRIRMTQKRNELRLLVDQANSRIHALLNAGATDEDNTALAEARFSLTKSKERTSEEMFSVDDKHRYRELLREEARLQKFLSSANSDVRVYQHEKPAVDAINKYGITFHKQHETFLKTGFRFGVGDEERLKFAAKIYRRLEESYANIYNGGYGSDNLINLLYDAVEGYNPNMTESQKEAIEAKALKIGREALEEHQKLTSLGLFPNSQYSDMDVNVVANNRTRKREIDLFDDNLS